MIKNWRMRCGLIAVFTGLVATVSTETTAWALLGFGVMIYFAYLEAKTRGWLG